MLCPERSKTRLGFHKCLGSRRPMLCPERDETLLGLQKCLGSKKPMLCPRRYQLATICVYVENHLHIALGDIHLQRTYAWSRVRSCKAIKHASQIAMATYDPSTLMHGI